MKKYFLIILALALILSGCKGTSDKTHTSSNSSTLSSVSNNGVESKGESENMSSTDTTVSSAKEETWNVTTDNPYASVAQIQLGIGEAKADSPKPTDDIWKKIFPMSGGADKQAEEMRNAIMNAADTVKAAPGGTTYYVSYNGNDENDGKSPEKAVNSLESDIFEELKPGDAVLFERGGLWRVGESSIFRFKKGVSYGAYGKGDKPAFYGSERNYADRNLWEPSNRKYVWKMMLTTGSAGFLVADDGELVGELKNGITGLTKNGDFYHSTSAAASTNAEDYFYLYCDKGNPGDVYDDIELSLRNGGITMSSGITVENFCFKYFGGLASPGGGSKDSPLENVKYINCEFGWCGGSYQNSKGDRYGNAIQLHNNCKNITVESCWFYHIVDAAITYQSNKSSHNWGDTHQYENIRFDKNLIEYCGLGIEVWSEAQLDVGYQKNISISENILRFAGYGWCATTTNGSRLTLICGGRGYWYNNRMSDFVIENNIFDCSARYLVYWNWGNTNPNEPIQPGLIIRNNSYYHKPNSVGYFMYWANNINPTWGTTKEDFENAIKAFDSSPKLIELI